MRRYEKPAPELKGLLSQRDKREEYLLNAFEQYALDNNLAALLFAIRQVVQASIGFIKLAEQSGIQRESLYRILSDSGNPKFSTISMILSVLGFQITFKHKT